MTTQEDIGPVSPMAVFGEGEKTVQADAQVRVLPQIPQTLGPLIATVQIANEQSRNSPPGVSSGRVDVDESPVFRLPLAEGGAVPDTSSGGVMPVAAVPGVGSQTLASALAARDFPAVLEALAFDVVLLPVVMSPHESLDTRVFPSMASGSACDLCVFSSAQTMERFLGDTGERLFIIQSGAGVVDYVAHHVDALDKVVLDAAGPSSMVISARDLASFLSDDIGEDEELPIVADDAEPVGTVVGFDLALDDQWGKVTLENPDKREHQIQRLVTEQTRVLGDNAAPLRRDMRMWLTKVAEQASQAGGSELAFLLTHTRDTGLAMSVVTYLHALGPDVGDVSHLDRILQHLVGKSAPQDAIMRIENPGGDIVRHSKIGKGNPDLGGDNVPLLIIDYWLAAPDHEHIGHVSVSTPHLNVAEAITKLADNIVLNGQWIIGEETQIVGRD